MVLAMVFWENFLYCEIYYGRREDSARCEQSSQNKNNREERHVSFGDTDQLSPICLSRHKVKFLDQGGRSKDEIYATTRNSNAIATQPRRTLYLLVLSPPSPAPDNSFHSHCHKPPASTRTGVTSKSNGEQCHRKIKCGSSTIKKRENSHRLLKHRQQETHPRFSLRL